MRKRIVRAASLVIFAGLTACASVPRHTAERVDWPSYNRSLTSERYAPLGQIDRSNVAELKAACTYDLGINTSFQTGPIVIGRTLYGSTEKETFAIDAATCAEKWRVREEVASSYLKVNRGVAYLDGRLFRGLQDGRVVSYDAATGRKLWSRRIADMTKGETVPAAPIAWNGLVFIGNAGGDNYGVKGRMYALDAKSGRQVWETYLVPREEDRDIPGTLMAQIAVPTWGLPSNLPITGGATWASYSLDPANGLLYVSGGNPAPDFTSSFRLGENLFANSVLVLDAKTGAYRRHFSLVPDDFHDWDVAAAPTLVTTRGGHRLLAAAAKDGQLYAHDLADGKRLYVTPTTTRENTTTPLTPAGTRFCPGTQGGSEWNGPAYSPQTNLIYVGAVDWCTTVYLADPSKLTSAAPGQPWTGARGEDIFGEMDPKEKWSGWITAIDADRGEVRWRYRTPAPVLAAVTPTAGGLVFAADMLGNAYAFDAESGAIRWRTTLDGAAGGGVITYEVDGRQRVAFVAGTYSSIWPVEKKSAKIVVFGRPVDQTGRMNRAVDSRSDPHRPITVRAILH
jgi:alcohol dehydrogenase (cytochrome c)